MLFTKSLSLGDLLKQAQTDKQKPKEPLRPKQRDIRKLTKDWTIRRYRCQWDLSAGYEIEVLEVVGSEALVNIREGTQLRLPITTVDEYTL